MSNFCPIDICPTNFCPIDTCPTNFSPADIYQTDICPIDIWPTMFCPEDISPTQFWLIDILPVNVWSKKFFWHCHFLVLNRWEVTFCVSAKCLSSKWFSTEGREAVIYFGLLHSGLILSKLLAIFLRSFLNRIDLSCFRYSYTKIFKETYI